MPSTSPSPRVPGLPSIDFYQHGPDSSAAEYTSFSGRRTSHWKVPCWRWLHLCCKPGRDGRLFLPGRFFKALFFFFFPNHSVGLVFCFFFLLLCYQFQSTENNQCFSFRVTWAIDRASTRWTAMSMSLPHTSKNGTLRKKKKKNKIHWEKVHQLQFTKVWSCSGRFSLVGPSRHSERSKWDLASTYGTTASPKHLTCFFLCDIPFGRWCVNSCNKGFTINVK